MGLVEIVDQMPKIQVEQVLLWEYMSGEHNLSATYDYNHPLTPRTLMSTTVDILCFYQHMYVQLLRVKYVLNLEICCDLNFTNDINFQLLEVVSR